MVTIQDREKAILAESENLTDGKVFREAEMTILASRSSCR